MNTITIRNLLTSAIIGLLVLAGSAVQGQEVPPPDLAGEAGCHPITTRLNVLSLVPTAAVRGQQVTLTARLTVPGKPWQGLPDKPVYGFLKAVNSLNAADIRKPKCAWTDSDGVVQFKWIVPKDLPLNMKKLYLIVHFDGEPCAYLWSGDYAILPIR